MFCVAPCFKSGFFFCCVAWFLSLSKNRSVFAGKNQQKSPFDYLGIFGRKMFGFRAHYPLKIWIWADWRRKFFEKKVRGSSVWPQFKKWCRLWNLLLNSFIYPCDKQGCCTRVLDFCFPINNFKRRIVKGVGMANFTHVQFHGNSNKTNFIWVVNRCSMFPVLICFQKIFLKKFWFFGFVVFGLVSVGLIPVFFKMKFVLFVVFFRLFCLVGIIFWSWVFLLLLLKLCHFTKSCFNNFFTVFFIKRFQIIFYGTMNFYCVVSMAKFLFY